MRLVKSIDRFVENDERYDCAPGLKVCKGEMFGCSREGRRVR